MIKSLTQSCMVSNEDSFHRENEPDNNSGSQKAKSLVHTSISFEGQSTKREGKLPDS